MEEETVERFKIRNLIAVSVNLSKCQTQKRRFFSSNMKCAFVNINIKPVKVGTRGLKIPKWEHNTI